MITEPMKKTKEPVVVKERRERLLFFDILRIFCVAAVVYAHSQYFLIPWFNKLFFSDGYLPLNIYSSGLQGWAVYGLIFISGAVLEYNYQGIGRFFSYTAFLFRRFIRLYPAFWISLLFGLLLDLILSFSAASEVIRNNLFLIVFEYTGFFIILGEGPGYINIMGWFICTILCLYLLYPYLSKFIRRYQLKALLAFLVISLVLRSLLFSNSGIFPDRFWMWFPLCNLFEFSLGIYLIQLGLYPKTVNSSPIIRKLADFSFYVFLFHIVVQTLLLVILKSNPQIVQSMTIVAFNQENVLLTWIFLLLYAMELLVSWIAMIIDQRVQRAILTNEYVRKKFLQ
jgi:peptidoglycan/LPS O-acetylase OafA/YrhL